MKLCVSCKACRHECPTGVDMAKMKIEVLAARVASTRAVAARPADRLSAALCRPRRRASRRSPTAQPQPAAAQAAREIRRHQRRAHAAGVPARRLQVRRRGVGPADGREVVLFADTFNRVYERENLDAALRVLVAGGYRVHLPKPADRGRPLCCGRTFLSAGLVDQRAAPSWTGWSRPTRRSPRAACRSSGSSRAAC